MAQKRGALETRKSYSSRRILVHHAFALLWNLQAPFLSLTTVGGMGEKSPHPAPTLLGLRFIYSHIYLFNHLIFLFVLH